MKGTVERENVEVFYVQKDKVERGENCLVQRKNEGEKDVGRKMWRERVLLLGVGWAAGERKREIESWQFKYESKEFCKAEKEREAGRTCSNEKKWVVGQLGDKGK